jgi:uridine kinase
VGLAGPSGAGKSVFCDKIREFMPGVCVLTMDMYNDASMLVEGNFDDPRLTDYDTLNQNLSDLKAGKTVEVPIYDFKQSKRVGYRTQESPASNVIIIEGIYALSDKLRPLQDLRVSISGGVHFDLVKRVMRDIDRSGQEPEDIIHQISETVYPMYKAFIEPDLRSAHLRVVNSFNPFAGFQVRNHVQSEDTRTGKYPRRRRSIHSDFRFVFSIFPTRTGAGRIMVGECQFTALSSVPRGDSRTRG